MSNPTGKNQFTKNGTPSQRKKIADLIKGARSHYKASQVGLAHGAMHTANVQASNKLLKRATIARLNYGIPRVIKRKES